MAVAWPRQQMMEKKNTANLGLGLKGKRWNNGKIEQY